MKTNIIKNKRRLRIKWKIFIFLLIFCAILLVILWLLQTVFLNYFYENIKIMELKKNTNLIANNIEDENLAELIASISKSSDVCIFIISSNDNYIFSEDIFSGCAIHKMSIEERYRLIMNAKEQNGVYSEYVSNQPPPVPEGFKELPGIWTKNVKLPQSLVYVKIIEKDDGETITIFMDLVITPVNATVTTLRYQLYLITAIMLILSVFLAILIAKRISKPIEEIGKSAKKLAGGTYDIHFKGKGFLEIEELSDTLNIAAVELSKVESLRRELIANISHDLRTPLSLIYSYAEMMHDFPDEITLEQTNIIMDETNRLTTLVNDMLDISKIESGTHDLTIKRFNLTKSVKSMTDRFIELVKKDGYHIIFDYDKDVFVNGDEGKLIQAYYNLLINAVNHTGLDKSIKVLQIINDNNIQIAVTDTGEGIAYDDLPYIWDRYYKVDKKHKRAVTGTGLGLSIVKKIMELHKGEYGVKSDQGKGSTFFIQINETEKDG